MSPNLLRAARQTDFFCRRAWGHPDQMGAIYPRDYCRPLDRRVIPWLLHPSFKLGYWK